MSAYYQPIIIRHNSSMVALPGAKQIYQSKFMIWLIAYLWKLAIMEHIIKKLSC